MFFRLLCILILTLSASFGVWVFCCGFLLQRTVTEKYSACEDLHKFYRSAPHDLKLPPSTGYCWYPQRFNKAVVIIIDALKYEFVVPDPSVGYQEKYFKNRMPIFNELASLYPKNAFLVKFVADAPTTTLQRLKGLFTGVLPTFIDAGANFYQYEITEDSVISQLKRKGNRLVFMGDDTWTSLFPDKFDRLYPFDSFNVKDLHTVDNGVLKHLYPELNQPNTWDALFAHFLGVDHCGHWVGQNHPEMAAKLSQMDQMIRNVTAILPKDAVLFVFGDHGMTKDGDHGGDSVDELDAALFVYSPTEFISQVPAGNSVNQIDLVPSLSLLLGLPIPYSNIGAFIRPLFTPMTGGNENFHMLSSLLPTWLNIQQIAKYLPETNVPLDGTALNKLKLLWDRILANDTVAADEFRAASHEFLQNVQKTARTAWATFNLPSMMTGLCIIATSLIGLWVLGNRITSTSRAIILIKKTDITENQCIIVTGLVFMWIVGPFSNSYIIYENLVTLYLLQSFLLVFLTNCFEKEKTWKLSWSKGIVILLASALVRIGSTFWRCREEHGNCGAEGLLLPLSQAGQVGYWRLFLALLFLGVIAFVYFNWLTPSRDSVISQCRNLFMFIACLTVVGHWFVQLKPAEVASKVLGNHQETLPNVAVLMCGLTLLATLCAPWAQWTISPIELQLSGGVPLLILLFTLCGESYVPSLGCIYLIGCLFGLLIQDHLSGSFSPWFSTAFWVLLANHGFFTTGHQHTFTSIHWRAGFVGAGNNPQMLVPGIRVLANTFSGHLVITFLLPVLASSIRIQREKFKIREQLPIYISQFICLQFMKLFFTALACMIHRRHLMVWKIFAPRFIFEMVTTLVSIIGVTFGCAFSLWTASSNVYR